MSSKRAGGQSSEEGGLKINVGFMNVLWFVFGQAWKFRDGLLSGQGLVKTSMCHWAPTWMEKGPNNFWLRSWLMLLWKKLSRVWDFSICLAAETFLPNTQSPAWVLPFLLLCMWLSDKVCARNAPCAGTAKSWWGQRAPGDTGDTQEFVLSLPWKREVWAPGMRCPS